MNFNEDHVHLLLGCRPQHYIPLGCVRYLYNYNLDKRQVLYKAEQKTMGYKECSADLTQLKKELPWLREPDSIALQASLEHLQDAYDNFSSTRERGDDKWGLPVFKHKRGTSRQRR